MAIAEKLVQVNQVKQDIKTAIETKGIPMTNVAFTEYANKILEISGGGGGGMTYEDYAKLYYTLTNNSTLFSNAWQDSQNESWIVENELYNIKLTQAYSNVELLPDVPTDVYTGDGLEDLFNDLENEIYFEAGESYFINGGNVTYYGDMKDALELPFSAYMFTGDTAVLISDISVLGLSGVSYALLSIYSELNEDFVLTDPSGYKTNGIIIPESWESIEDNYFNGDINYEEKFETNNLRELDVPLVIPNSITSISEYAFSGWTSNDHPLVIPDSIISIGNGTFYNWTSNNQPLVIPDSITSIGEYAFYNWTSNDHPLVIPDSITSIGEYAFVNWTSNDHPLAIPNSVTSIGDYAFGGWTSNNQPLVIPNSVTSISDYAFSGWSSNNQPLVIPESITSIGHSAFRDWQANNQPLVMPNSVTSIGHSAFRDWQANNQPLVMPNSVTSIGSWAFNNWALVPYVEIQSITPPTLVNSNAFNNQNDAPIYVPDASVNDYKTATNWVDLASRIFPISEK